MSPPTACLTANVLDEMLAGRLTPEQAEQFSQHLEACPRCPGTFGPLADCDPLLETVRRCRTVPDGQTEAVPGDLLRRLIDLTATAGATTAGDAVAVENADSVGEVVVRLLPPQGPEELGRLGTYRLLRALGAGGMGVVFLALDTQLQRSVALKVMRPSLAAKREARERFLREARSAAALDHDRVVTIHQVGEDRGLPFLAMQLLQGETLEQRLQREGRLTPAEVVRIGREAAEGLAAAHERGLIHRDIKPANLWLENVGQVFNLPSSPGRLKTCPTNCVKLLDFGLARPVADDAHLTGSGVVLGTPAYMAPEQARGETLDARSDLFSLGCVLYRAATGVPPFQGPNALAVVLAVGTDNPKPPREIASEIPPALSDLIVRLLGKNPAGRPSSALVVVETLARLQKEMALPVALPVRRARRTPRARLAVVASVVALLVLGGGWRSRSSSASATTRATSSPRRRWRRGTMSRSSRAAAWLPRCRRRRRRRSSRPGFRRPDRVSRSAWTRWSTDRRRCRAC